MYSNPPAEETPQAPPAAEPTAPSDADEAAAPTAPSDAAEPTELGEQPDAENPKADPEPPAPSEMKCVAAGPRLAEVSRTALPRSTPAKEGRLWVYKNGAWQRHFDGKLAAEGCLTPDQLVRLEKLIAAADLKPPPPPAIQCAAMPITETRVALPPRGGAVSHSDPCGRPAHDSIYEVETALREMVAGKKVLFPELR